MAERTITITDLTDEQAELFDKQAEIEGAKRQAAERTVQNSLAKEATPTKQLPVKQDEHKTRVQQVAKGNVTRKKESTASKFKRAFFGEDVVNVKDYVIFDVMIPALKATISDMIGNGVEVLLFGEARGKRKKKGDNYAGYYRRRDDRDSDGGRRRSVSSDRAFDDICLDSRAEAEVVISTLTDLAYDYGQVSVADLYDLVGISASFTDEKYGWFKGDLRGATVRRCRDGFLLDLPRATRLD